MIRKPSARVILRALPEDRSCARPVGGHLSAGTATGNTFDFRFQAKRPARRDTSALHATVEKSHVARQLFFQLDSGGWQSWGEAAASAAVQVAGPQGARSSHPPSPAQILLSSSRVVIVHPRGQLRSRRWDPCPLGVGESRWQVGQASEKLFSRAIRSKLSPPWNCSDTRYHCLLVS